MGVSEVGDPSGKRRHLSKCGGPSKSGNSSEKWGTRPEGILTEAETPRISWGTLGKEVTQGEGRAAGRASQKRGEALCKVGDTLAKQGQKGGKRDNSSEKQGSPQRTGWGLPGKAGRSPQRSCAPREVRGSPRSRVSPERSRSSEKSGGGPSETEHRSEK